MIQKGDKAPAFEAKNQDGKTVKLEDFKGKKLVVYFYPKDNTPTCTTEACNLRDNYHRFLKEGYEVVGVSPDSEKSHQKFKAKFELPFDLLSDKDLTLANAFGVWGEKFTFGKKYMGIKRTTFVIDAEGSVVDVITEVQSKIHADQILNS
ncbi:thioredoxin-dependent thiol peroxidase [Leadbetterella byssophila]|uniref:thioredoxin-dependent peroxiredoxin n=1 Tax=Leadbetterella byssophila (strain DSM 17132 / JCM 16389 / KACC 11308 / NBRC 106382 / 4M15) TaxID=649349 RepID=E4RU80_LEAB4|nr:thioredoxin-dependent thiol peroxidase [Leadbetterella byssophila]ADQ16914.1 Peroxiredoxin [Leadbetterella byssophila DSM 17132]